MIKTFTTLSPLGRPQNPKAPLALPEAPQGDSCQDSLPTFTKALFAGAAVLALTSPGVQAQVQIQPQASQPQEFPYDTILQKHLSFFDGDHNGQLTREETASGLRKLGLGWTRSEAVATFINLGVGASSHDHWYDPTTINLAKVHHAKHGSDTGIMDAQGNFVTEKFDSIFTRFDANRDGALSQSEINTMHDQLKTDQVGDFASKGEFSLLMELAGESRTQDGQTTKVLTRDTMLSLYDGTLFYKLAGETAPFPGFPPTNK